MTAEAGILDLPTVVSYRVPALTWWIGKRLVKLKWLSIVNLVLNQTAFQELLQDDATPANLAAALRDILPGGSRRQHVLAQLGVFRDLLGRNTDVDDAVAVRVLSFV